MIRSAKMNDDHAAEADAAVPQHRGERHVADRADEREHGDERSDERTPDLREQRVVDEEERLPERLRAPTRRAPRRSAGR